MSGDGILLTSLWSDLRAVPSGAAHQPNTVSTLIHSRLCSTFAGERPPQRISMPKFALPRARSDRPTSRDHGVPTARTLRAARRVAVLAGSLFVAASGALVAAPQAAAAPCPDVEVVFARGTAETAPPVGLTGLSFAQALRSQLPGKTVSVYGVDYPASNNFNNRVAFVRNVVDGITAAQDHIKATAARCPNTGIVLGGYSQGSQCPPATPSTPPRLPSPCPSRSSRA